MLQALLADLARQGQTISYGALAERLAIPGPGRIARLTAELERLMAEDAAAGRPFRAAVCVARGSTLPAPGFFAAARALGRPMDADPAGMIAAERTKLAHQP